MPAKSAYLGSLQPEFIAHDLARIVTQHKASVLLVAADMQQAYRWQQELPFFLGEKVPVTLFPDWETLPYDPFSPHQDITSQRLHLLSILPYQAYGVTIVSVNTLLHHLSPPEFLQGNSLSLKLGQRIDIARWKNQLLQSGYYLVKQVFSRGEFAVRGSIIDVYPMGSKQPVRIELFDDEIDTLRLFDPETQRSFGTLEQLALLPAHEYPLTTKSADFFIERWHQNFPENTWQSPVLQSIDKQRAAAGAEYYLPLFFEKTASLIDYLPKDTLIVSHQQVPVSANLFIQQVNDRYQQMRFSLTSPALAPQQAFIQPVDLFHRFKSFAQLRLEQTVVTKPGAQKQNSVLRTLPDLHIQPQAQVPLLALKNFIASANRPILCCAASEGRAQILQSHLAKLGFAVDIAKNWQSFITQKPPLAISIGLLDQGFIADHYVVISENDLFADLVLQRRRRQTTEVESNNRVAIRDFTELNIGDAVVHLKHGIGRYQGLTTLALDGQAQEFLTLHYANDNKLYVPISDLHLISRYSSAEFEHVPINVLGTDRWQKTVNKAAKQIRDVAAELLAIYAKRERKKGFACQFDSDDYQRFCDGFIFEETADQRQAIKEVTQDLLSDTPMDRLLCGDVGFGKTEVAMRAAFLVAHTHKQVVILVPTTLLAEQHDENFSDRFAHWPIRVESLSRFKTAKQQQAVIAGLKAGHVDIVIGTHRLLNTDVEYQDLGLVIIDEEHRFGVRHKEKLKALRADVNILTMTATPIPRTLNMAMSKIRDLSLMTTPPAKRLSVLTFVKSRTDELIKEAIRREVMRGGQVYFLHNNVTTIDHCAELLRALLPDIKFAVGHGQMRERELEKIMADFYHNRYQVLVCTTIIETGIDVPNANTMIIDRADHLGLAQLHQLRGRVGRSHHQAYSYLLCPSVKGLSGDAKKRLRAIEKAAQLGAGFELASHDLEIRGAGELLGDEQSGHINRVGFNLYLELLNQAVKAMERGEEFDINHLHVLNLDIDLGVSSFIPESYLPDVHLRLQLYKRISEAASDSALDDIQVEMIDRFGLVVQEVKNLFAISSLRLRAQQLGVVSLQANAKGLSVEFSEQSIADPAKIIQWVQLHSQIARFVGSQKIRVEQEMLAAERRFELVDQLLQAISPGLS